MAQRSHENKGQTPKGSVRAANSGDGDDATSGTSRRREVSLPREVAALLQRFTILSEEEQLLAYNAVREYLVAGGMSAPADTQLDERGEALRVMRAVMEHLGLDDPRKLEVKQFDAAPEEVREDWRSGRVIRAWARWKFAREALAGAKPRPTARQRALKSRSGAAALRTDDYFAGMREWLAAKPPKLGSREYDAWAKERNAAAAANVLPFPRYHGIRILRISWESALQVARGKISLEEATKTAIQTRASTSCGPHDLVSPHDIAAMAGKPMTTIQRWLVRDNFPVPVLVVGGSRSWFRSDVELFLKGKTPPARTRNELAGIYVTRPGAAKILGVASVTLEGMKGRPDPVARVGTKRLWLRSEIEAFRDERKRQNVGRGRFPREASG